MSVLPVGIGASGSPSYQIANSLRFRASASAYLSRTAGAATSTTTGTLSAWVKRGALSSRQFVFSASNYEYIYFDETTNGLYFSANAGGHTRRTTAAYRDPSGWLHIVLVYDSTNATASDRTRLYVNGTRITSFDVDNGDVPQNTAFSRWNVSGYSQSLGRLDYNNTAHLDGYLSEFYWIDGQALDPSSFGETNSDGVWVPKAYEGTYGNNGFHLDFSDATSTTTLGYDAAGSNDWTCNNISLTAGVTYDHMVDTPTDNFAVLNPLDSALTLSEANLRATDSGSTWYRAKGSIPINDVDCYFEATIVNSTSNSAQIHFGVQNATVAPTQGYTSSGFTGVEHNSGGSLIVNGSTVASGLGSRAAGVVLQVAYKFSSREIWIGYSNTWYDSSGGATGNPGAGTNPSGTLTAGISYVPMFSSDRNSVQFNFGQRPFAYDPPTGFKALCTANIPDGGSITSSGNFTGNASADGPFVWLNGNPETMTINGNAVTWGTHADKTAGGFKVITSSSSYNAAGSNSFSVSVVGEFFGDENTAPNTAQGNP